MTKTYTLIQFTLVLKRGRRVVGTQPCWLATCRFKDGPGMQVKNMTTTRDMAKAARFSLASAEAIAVQFSQLPAKLVRDDGTVLVEETQRLQAEQLRRHEMMRQLQREMAEDFARVFAPVMPLLREAAGLPALTKALREATTKGE